MTESKAKSDSRQAILERLQAALPYLRERYGVTRMALYGSVARNEAGAESDVDLLVEFSRPLGFEFVDLAFHLEDVLGRNVDLGTFETLQHTAQNPRRRALVVSIREDLIDVEAPA